MVIFIVYYAAVIISFVHGCTQDNTAGCDIGHVLYMNDTQDYCLSTHRESNDNPNKLVLCVFDSSQCSLWTAIPFDNHSRVKLKLKDQDLLVSTELSLDNTGQKFEITLLDEKVPYDVFKIDFVTLNLEGENCIGLGDEINDQIHLFEVVQMSHFGMNKEMQLVPVCPASTKDRWHFKISGPVYHNPVDLPCDLTPCENGMICTNNGDGTTTCTKPPTACELHPCDEGWICTNTGSETRICEDIILTACEKSPCKNGGQCINNEDGTRTCDCSGTHNFLSLTGYEGQDCETACILGCLKPKRNNIFRKCHLNNSEINGNKVLCGQKPRRWECKTDCQPDDNCIPVVCRTPTACDRKPCKHGGLCTNNDDGTRTCDCRVTYNFSTLQGYTGDRCETACDLGCLKPARNNTFRTCKSHLNPADLNGAEILCGKNPRKWKCRTDCAPQDGCIPVLCQSTER